jgi:crossover junction endonuclease EME1
LCRQKLTPLSVSKNGDHVAKSDPNKEEIKKSLWLKALVALPKTSGAIARAIAKEYPSMRALLNAYLDSAKSVSVCPSQPGTHLVLASSYSL